ncbi:MAG: hypothetical protein EHM53_04280 [Methanoregulaceae archaeon]|nr:MAG: hypothetical protein EHM53_04280 [Methanoregulaceae archaeon]
MDDDRSQTFRELTALLGALPIGDYLVSEDFSRFLRNHDLEDAWNEYLVLSRDKPDLYGDSVIKNAFSLFLSHIFHRRREMFLSLFSGLLADFSRGIPCTLPVDDIKPFLLLLGYPEAAIDHTLFSLRVRQKADAQTR